MATTAQETPRAANQAPDPVLEPVKYLYWHKWKCFGNPNSDSFRCWYDPLKPRVDRWEKVEVVAANQYGKLGPVHVKNHDNETVRAVQERFIPKAEPVSRDEALAIQMQRDEEAAIRAETERAEAATRAEKAK